MIRTTNISVCMATYNGSKYLDEQLTSILKQLADEDELIVVDDASTDLTSDLLRSYNDVRIKVYVNDINIGVNKSFEKAISLAKNEYVFLADQDDIWTDNRVNLMLNALKRPNVNLVSGNSSFIDAGGALIDYPVIPLKESESQSKMRNIYRIFLGTGAYFGCAMAFKRELTKSILPFPRYIESHDLWIAKSSILQGKNFHLEDEVLLRRVHGRNASIIQRALLKKSWSRVVFVISIGHLFFRTAFKANLDNLGP